MMFGGVRTDNQTLAAPPVARSCAISIPDDPGPTTRTRFPLNGKGFRYPDECNSAPVKPSRPGQSGISGVCSYPVATTTYRESMSPVLLSSRQLPSRLSMGPTGGEG